MTLPNKSQQALVKNKLSHQWRVRSRLILSILVAAIVAIFLPNWFSLSTHIFCIWNAGMISFLLATWTLMIQAKPKTMRRNAQSQDEGRLVILSLITAAACVSMSSFRRANHFAIAKAIVSGTWHSFFFL